MYEKIKNYVVSNFEQVFVIVIMAAVLLIGVFVPYKLSMLHFFYLPVMLAGFALGRKKALQGAVLVILIVVVIFLLQYEQFTLEKKFEFEGILSVIAWAGFLLLSGYTVGYLHDRSEEEKSKATQLNIELKKMFAEGRKAFDDKKQFNRDLEESRKRIEELDTVVIALNEKLLENLTSIIDPRVANLVYEKKLKDEKREISVLTAGLASFNAYASTKQPKVVSQTLTQYLSEMEQILSDFHGHLEGFAGGIITCEFGIPVEYETHSVMAVVAALRMQQKLKKLQFPWELQVGVSSGPSVTGFIGRGRKTYTAVGAPSDHAELLRIACRPGRILIDAECYSKVSYCIEAKLIKDKDAEIKDDISRLISNLERKLATNPEDVKTIRELGDVYLKELHQPTRALRLFEQALKVEPDNTDVKIAYAEANMEKESLARLSVDGPAKFSAYEVIGTRNPFLDINRLPSGFSKKYSNVEELIGIPADLILPIEAIDGSIGHSRVVAVLSYAVAETLGLGEKEKKDVLMAGYIQDIGKKLIPHEILSRTRRLTEKEFVHIRRHPAEATRVLSSAGFNKLGILEIVEHHHEKFNGKGYPHGKKGDGIPLGARITAVADAYDAMVAWRPYKKTISRKDAVGEINKGARSGAYDPAVVQAFLTIMDGE